MKRIRGIIIRALAILAGFWLADLAAARIQAGIAAGRTAQQIMDDMTTMPRHPLMLGFDRTSLLCGLAGAAAVGLFLLYRWSMGSATGAMARSTVRPAGLSRRRWHRTPTAISAKTCR